MLDVTTNNGLLDLSEAAKFLRVSNRVLRGWCKERRVRYAKLNLPPVAVPTAGSRRVSKPIPKATEVKTVEAEVE